jgi:hypothetical protein
MPLHEKSKVEPNGSNMIVLGDGPFKNDRSRAMSKGWSKKTMGIMTRKPRTNLKKNKASHVL